MSRRWVLAISGLGIVLILWLWLAPPRVWLNWTKRVELGDPIAAGERLVEKYHCRDCHRIGAAGALKAPALNGITQHLTDQDLALWLGNPDAMRANTAMPDFRLSDTEIAALIAYLQAVDLK